MIKTNCEPKVDTEKAADILKEIAKDKMGGWFNLPRKFDRGTHARKRGGEKNHRRVGSIGMYWNWRFVLGASSDY